MPQGGGGFENNQGLGLSHSPAQPISISSPYSKEYYGEMKLEVMAYLTKNSVR